MTDLIKKKIAKLRAEGKSYLAIGNELGLKKDTVHTYCRRNGMAGNVRTDTFCKCCGKRLIQPETGRKKTFCDMECKNKWFKENQ